MIRAHYLRYQKPDLGYREAAVLIVVLWICAGLVALVLVFGQIIVLQYRSADSTVAGIQAEQAAESAMRYVCYVLENLEEPGTMPDVDNDEYKAEAVPVGDATYWLLGRHPDAQPDTMPVFSLVDECSKLNLNTATVEMLANLPRMTPECAAAIVDWRDADSQVSENGAEAETYTLRKPAYRCKNGPFETVLELKMVYGAKDEILFGEDTNLNGILDPNENDGEASPPSDNQDGELDPGIVEYLTVYSRSSQPVETADGGSVVDVNTKDQEDLRSLLRETLGETRANDILSQLGAGAEFRSILEFYIRSKMTPDECDTLADSLTVSGADSGSQSGAGSDMETEIVPINVNTACEEVLSCIPGIGSSCASALVAYRLGHTKNLHSVAWVAQVLDEDAAIQAGPYLTTHTYQFSADVAAVGQYGRGCRRIYYVLDISDGQAKAVYRRDRTDLGWALGKDIRSQLSEWRASTR
ncbi:MAG TPA: helix-hairpin-helix domain-containing protein [bacterium]|nr:helix-hairpin-helix domain-containing protein [bacterium]HQL62575.1 helix-hairpin-helix domain-containing protein [bacterium]